MALVIICVVLLAVYLFRKISGKKFFCDSYLGFTLLFFLSFTLADLYSYNLAMWILAVLSFVALREYFSLADIRLQDRLGILGAYLSIPFMYYFIHLDWYGMFIISIPVYSFLAIPILVTIGGKEAKGTVFSIGAIVLGLFLFVFCIGHITYLMRFSVWMPVMMIINVLICDIVTQLLYRRFKYIVVERAIRMIVPMPFTITVAWLLSGLTTIPVIHSVALAMIIPPLAMMGQHTGNFIKLDLGIADDNLFPGRGQILDNLKSFFFVAPVFFHYTRYFLEL
jgi:phosphatidate cytidylyltransferase